MEMFSIVAVLLAITAALAYLNERLIGLPTTIGVMLVALAISVILLVLGSLGVLSIAERARELVVTAALEQTLLGGGALGAPVSDVAAAGSRRRRALPPRRRLGLGGLVRQLAVGKVCQVCHVVAPDAKGVR